MANCGISYEHPRHLIDTTGDGMLEFCDTSVRTTPTILIEEDA